MRLINWTKVYSLARESLDRLRSSTMVAAGGWYSVGTFAEKGLAFLFTFVFAHFLTTEEFGTVSLFISWISLLLPVITLNAYSSVQRARFDFPRPDFLHYKSSIVSLSLISSTIAIILILMIPWDVAQDVVLLNKDVLLLAAAVAGLTAGIKTKFSAWKVDYHFRSFTLVSLVKRSLRLAVSLCLIILLARYLGKDPATGRIVGIAAVDITLGIILVYTILRAGKTFISGDYWRYALAYSIPLIPHTISGVLLAHFDRIFIGNVLGAGEVGSYTFAYQLSEPIRYLWVAANAAWVPWLFEKLKARETHVVRSRSKLYVMVFTAMTIVSMIFLPIIVSAIAPPDYLSGLPIMPLIIGAGYMTFLYSFYVNIEFFEKKTGWISTGTILAGVANIVMNLILLPRFGILGAAWATLGAYLLQFVFHLFIVKIFSKRDDVVPDTLIILASGLILSISYFSSRLFA